MKKTFSVLATLLLVFSALIIPEPQSAAAAGYPSMTYIRFNRYGSNIYATYCISADSYSLGWGEITPNTWYTVNSYGSINNCVTKYLFSQVSANDKMEVYIDTFGNSNINEYYFHFTAIGSGNLDCEMIKSTTFLQEDDRLISSTACAFRDW